MAMAVTLPPSCLRRSQGLVHGGTGACGLHTTGLPRLTSGGNAFLPYTLRQHVRMLSTSVATGEQGRGGQAEGAPGSKTSCFIGVSWAKSTSAWLVQLWDPQTKRVLHIGYYASEEDAARARDCATVKMHGPEYSERNFPDDIISKPPVSLGDKRRKRKTSRYIGVGWSKIRKAWEVHLWDPQTKRQRSIGQYSSEDDAARAYDCAAMKMHGPEYSERNFPGKIVTEPPASRGDEQRGRKTSRYIGVGWRENRKAWGVHFWDPQTKHTQYLGCYASEDDAARAYDCAAVKMHSPDFIKRNFPGEIISEPPVRTERKTSRYISVSWRKGCKAWVVCLWDPQTKRVQHIGLYSCEVDAARAYDCAAVKMRGPDFTKRNFPGEIISEPPVSRGDKRRGRTLGRRLGQQQVNKES
ncbi:hypothetical protein FOA52_007584 [Chlamydomonas sp. UWO 241]|nr:hypothetical protein FOA52_007584 [Chlamydomonas sp. UWO 241]